MVNQKIADDVLEIMKELYENHYPIEKMHLIDEYGADDEASMSDNNTSAFNYRTIAGTNRLSKHGQGLTVDINQDIIHACGQKQDHYGRAAKRKHLCG